MKIAITGATGQLGQLVVNKLKDKISPDKIVALPSVVGVPTDHLR